MGRFMNPFDQENLSQAKKADDVIDDGKDPPRSAEARGEKKRRELGTRAARRDRPEGG
jgi:hypothetical protein